MGAAFRVIIPSRFASTRLPGKPLRLIGDKPMIQHAWERALESGCGEALVATDDERIAEAVRGFGGRAVLTSSAHPSGTDRLAEVAELEKFADDDIIVNLQGDEPFVPGGLLAELAGALEHSSCELATLATPIHEVRDVFDPNVVKVVIDTAGVALYFSRAPIPWVRGGFAPGQIPEALPADAGFFRHLGLYAYRVGALRRIAASPPAMLERAESLEQLRALSLGIRIHVGIVSEPPGHGVDTPEDLERVTEAYLARAR